MRISDWSSDVCSSDLYKADGFVLPIDKLFEEGLPAIVLLNDRGYRHFVVVKGLRSGRVLVGDPARGTRSLTRRDFGRLWDNNVLFVVHNRRELADFNQSRDWRVAPQAPLETGVGRQSLRSEEHTSELQSLMRISYAVFCL